MLESRRADRACLVRVSVAVERWLRGSKVRSEYYGARLQLESREVQAELWLRGSKVRSEYYGARLQLESREVQADAVQG